MRRQVRTELLKLRTVRSFVAGLAAAPAVAALVAVAFLNGAGEHGNAPLGPDSLLGTVGAPTSVVTLVALFLGLVATTGEHRHQTVTTTFLATPRRREVVLAKLATSALVGAAVGILSLLGSAAVAVPWLRSAGVAVAVDGDVVRVAVGLVAATTLYGALGVSVGALVRNQAAAVALVLTWLLAVEGLVADVFSVSAVGRWLPAAAGRALVAPGPSADRALVAPGPSADRALVAPGPSADALGPLVAAGVFAGYVVALAAAAALFTIRRDVT